MNTYQTDFYLWSKQQSSLLRDKEYTKLDIENLIEEIESLGRSERRRLISHLVIYFQHLLKTEYQPERDCNSWKDSIRKSLYQSKKTLQDNPSLKSQLVEILDCSYCDARFLASSETYLPEETFPEKRYLQIQDIFEDIEDKYKE